MSKKLVLFLVVFFFSGFSLARADVVINEVQLSPTGERFIELYNDSGSSVDLTGWYMQRKTANGTTFGSLVSNPNFEGKTIDANGYFVISRSSLSSSDIVLGSLTLTESNTIQIKNSGGDVVDKIGWGDASDCDSPCPSNPSEGRSIQRSGSNWVISTPTPGEENEDTDSSSSSSDPDNDDSADSNDDTEDEDTSSTTTKSTSSTKSKSGEKVKVIPNPTMKAKIVASAVAFAGQPLEIKTNITGYYNEKVVLGIVDWNFGDGGSFEQIDNFNTFTHTYYYPGEYVLFLEYYSEKSSVVPEVTTKMIVKVLPTTVVISRVGDTRDFFVELSNSASSDIDVSNWVLSANGKVFILPRNSVIMSKKQVIISGKVSGFTYDDRDDLKLSSSTGDLVSNYSATPVSTFTAKTVSQPKMAVMVPQAQAVEQVSATTEEEIPLENLEASVVESGIVKNNSIQTYLMSLIFTVFVGASAYAVYFIRQKKGVSRVGDDFKILDE